LRNFADGVNTPWRPWDFPVKPVLHEFPRFLDYGA
jgi:hypothetical protein